MKMAPLSLPPAPAPTATTRSGRVFAFLPDGERLVLAGTGPKSLARLVSLTTGQDILMLEKPPPNVGGVAASDDGAVIALAAGADRVVFYDPLTGGKLQTLRAGGVRDLEGLHFAPGSHVLLHSSWNGLTAIDVGTGPATRPLRRSAAFPDNTMYHATAFSPQGDRFACLWSDHTSSTNLSLCDWPSGEETARMPLTGQPHRYGLCQIVFSQGGQAILIGIPDGSVALWDLTEATLPGSSTTWITQAAAGPGAGSAGDLYAGCLGFSPDGTQLAYGQGSMLGLWAWPSGQCLGQWRLPGRDPMAYRVGFSPSGRDVVLSKWGSGGIFVYRLADLLKPY